MRAHGVVILLVLGLASCAVHFSGNRIPLRCIQASVTPVSCRTPTNDNLLPHPDDCELFYYCVTPWSLPICRQCPANLHFNPTLHVCDIPASAGCQGEAATDSPVGTEASTTDVTAAA